MDFASIIKDLTKRSVHASQLAMTEEATKTSVIFPFIRALTANDIICHIKQRVAYFAALFLCVAELQQMQCVLTLWFSDFSISVAF